MPHEVIMPALGMTQDTGVIVTWRKAEGDAVAIGDPLFDVETDKTTMEVEAAHAGTLTEIRASVGTDIPVGQTIAIIAEAVSSDAEVLAGTGVDSRPGTATAPETKPSTPTAPKPPEPPTSRNKSAAPPTQSAVPILASPKAKFEAHRRGIDLRRLVDQGIAQPFHVADLDRLQIEAATAAPPDMSQLSARLDLQALDTFVSWVEGKTDRQNMRRRVLAAFAAAAFRSGDASDLAVSVLSVREGESTYRDPDLRGLGEPDDSVVDQGNRRADLALVDLTETRLTGYKPPAQRGRPTIIFTQGVENGAVATLHFCGDDLPLLRAARFLDSFAERINVPALQLL
ncbi:MAG: biotin/lipoyl-containing protein [Geminicoccaceae bacterium]